MWKASELATKQMVVAGQESRKIVLLLRIEVMLLLHHVVGVNLFVFCIRHIDVAFSVFYVENRGCTVFFLRLTVQRNDFVHPSHFLATVMDINPKGDKYVSAEYEVD